MTATTHDYDDIVTFAHVLYECGQLDEISDVLAYFEKPWKWDKEFAYWMNEGGTLEKAVLGAMTEAWANGEI